MDICYVICCVLLFLSRFSWDSICTSALCCYHATMYCGNLFVFCFVLLSTSTHTCVDVDMSGNVLIMQHVLCFVLLLFNNSTYLACCYH